jgi:hypothetical protein
MNNKKTKRKIDKVKNDFIYLLFIVNYKKRNSWKNE